MHLGGRMQGARLARRTRLLLLGAFGSIAGLLLVAQVLSYVHRRDVELDIDEIERNSFASIRLVQRIGLDVEHEQTLIDQHIIENDPAPMRRIELRIAAVRSDLATAARSYIPLVTYPGEATAWAQLSEDTAEVDRRTIPALELSRQNKDREARETMTAIQPLFDAVDRDVEELVAINQREVQRSARRVRELRATEVLRRAVLGGATILLTLLTGLGVARLISRKETALRRYAMLLEERNRELDAFAGRVAHDLRGSLGTISLAASVQAERYPNEGTPTTILQKGIAQMTTLIDDLLGLSRVGARMADAVARIDFVASSVEEDLRPMVNGVKGTLHVDVAPASVQGSEGLLRQVLWNLGENAVKYRRLDVPLAVEIDGRRTGGAYELQLSDNGSGMSPDEVRHACEPFFRGHQDRPVPGTGLGLAIVRRIVEASGGTLSIDSQRGRGTAFVMRLRLGKALERQEPV